ncbi:MAG: hypothetical protein ACERKD_19525 [Prolixibacteraceae bacterium]
MKMDAKKYLLPFKLLIDRSGANYSQVAQLVNLKLILDNRKKLPNNRKKSDDPKNAIVRQAFTFVFVGLFLVLMMYRTDDPYLFIFTSQVMLMVMSSITMLAEYSVSLFDTRDNSLLMPLPANGQTIGWARVIHIMIYLLLLSLSLTLPPIVFCAIKFGVASALLFLISVVLSTLFTLFFTVFIYLTLIKFTDGEKLKDTMMYLQVVLTIVMVIAYQLIPRIIMPAGGEPLIMHKSWYFVLLPPAWFTSFSTLIAQFDAINMVGAAIAFIVPLVTISLIGKKLFYGFNESLVKLDSQTSGKTSKRELNNKNSWWLQSSAFIMGVQKEEFPIFRLMWKLSGRERLFKQSLLPLLAYAIIIPTMSIFAGGTNNIEGKYLIFLYFTVMSSSMLPTVLTIGNNKNAEWMYTSLPNMKADLLFKGALKAAIAKFFLPTFLLIAAPLIYFRGAIAVIDITTIFVYNYFIATVVLYFQKPYFMFTQEKNASQGGKTAAKMMLVIFAAMPLGFLHSFLVKQNSLWIIVMLAVFAILLTLMNRVWMKQRFNWKYVNSFNNQF